MPLAFLAKNSRLAKSLYDLGWGDFLRYLEDAMSARGHLLLYAGQFTPTTQACSTPRCGTHHDRDVNAAANIQADAIRRFLESHGAESALKGDASEHAPRGTLSRLIPPELQAFLARGGMTAWGQRQSCQQRRVVAKTTAVKVPKKRKLPTKSALSCTERLRAG